MNKIVKMEQMVEMEGWTRMRWLRKRIRNKMVEMFGTVDSGDGGAVGVVWRSLWR